MERIEDTTEFLEKLPKAIKQADKDIQAAEQELALLRQDSPFPLWVTSADEARFLGALKFCGVDGKGLQSDSEKRLTFDEVWNDKRDGSPQGMAALLSTFMGGVVITMAVSPGGGILAVIGTVVTAISGIALGFETECRVQLGISALKANEVDDIYQGKVPAKRISAEAAMQEMEARWKAQPELNDDILDSLKKIRDLKKWKGELPKLIEDIETNIAVLKERSMEVFLPEDWEGDWRKTSLSKLARTIHDQSVAPRTKAFSGANEELGLGRRRSDRQTKEGVGEELNLNGKTPSAQGEQNNTISLGL